MYQLQTPVSADRFADSEGRGARPRTALVRQSQASGGSVKRRHYAAGRSGSEVQHFAGTHARLGAFLLAITSGPNHVWQAGVVAASVGVFGRRAGLSDPIVGCLH